jgi:hypothetical protein
MAEMRRTVREADIRAWGDEQLAYGKKAADAAA